MSSNTVTHIPPPWPGVRGGRGGGGSGISIDKCIIAGYHCSHLPNEACDIINCLTIYYEKDVRAGMLSFAKKSSEPRCRGK